MTRTCANCPCILRAGNEGPLCGPCERSAEMRALAEGTPRKKHNGPHPVPDQTMLDALPAGNTELAERSGLSRERVKKRMAELVVAGRVVRRCEVGDNGRRRVIYHVPEALSADDLDDLDELMGSGAAA